MIIFFQIVGGLLLLLAGGDILVRGSVALAKHLGVSTLVIGLTVIAMGTSAPEIMVSIRAALSNHHEIAIGNVIGSNIANIFLALGISAIIFQITAHKEIIRRDIPVLLLLTAMTIFFCWTDEVISRAEGMILLVSGIIYTVYTVKTASKNEDMQLPSDISNLKAIAFVALGIAFLAYGSGILVEGSSDLARMFGISEAVIGVTIVAIGGSAPEIVTCITAAMHKHSDLAAGNIIGSNIVNVIGGLSLASIVRPLSVSQQFLNFDLWVMALATVIIALTIKRINRTTGVLFCLLYICYTGSQFFNANSG